jgi:putative transposase
VNVNPAYTSQDCSGCGQRVPKTLKERVHVCPYCGLILDRDVNAARNILQIAVGQHSVPA